MTINDLNIQNTATVDTNNFTFTVSTMTIGSVGILRIFDPNNLVLTTMTANNGTINYTGNVTRNINFTSYFNLTTSGAGIFTCLNTATTAIGGTLTVTSGTLNLAAAQDMTVTGNVLINGAGGTLNANSRTITVSGNWDRSAGAFTNAGSTVIFNGAASQIQNGETFNNMQVTGGITTLSATPVTAAGTFTISGGTLSIGVNTLDLTGAVNPSLTGGIIDMSSTTGGTINFHALAFNLNGTSITNLGGAALSTITGTGTFSITNAGSSLTCGNFSNVTSGTFSITNGTYTAGGAATSVINCTSFSQSGGAYNGGTGVINSSGSFSVSAGTFTAGTSTVVMTGASNLSSNQNLYNLTINNSNAVNMLTDITLNNNLTISGGASLTTGAHSLTVSGSIILDGTLNSTGEGVGNSVGVTGNVSNNAGNGATGTFNANGAGGVNIGGYLLIFNFSATNNASTLNTTISGNFGVVNTFNNDNGLIIFNNNGTINQPDTFYNLTISGGTRSTNGDITVNKDLAISGGTLDAATNSNNINIGTVGVTPSSLSITATGILNFASGGTLTFQGDGVQTFSNTSASGSAIYNLTINKTNIADNVTIPNTSGDITIQGILTVTRGVFIQNRTLILSNTNNVATVVSVAANGTWRNIGGALNSNIRLGGTAGNGNVSISGIINFDGGAGKNLQIRSSIAGRQRDWSGTGTFTVGNIDVQDQTCISGTPAGIFCTAGSPGIDSGNNINWFLGNNGIGVAGTVYLSDRVTNVGAGDNLTLVVYRNATGTISTFRTTTRRRNFFIKLYPNGK